MHKEIDLFCILCNFDFFMYAPSDFEQSLLMKAFAETCREFVFPEYLYLFYYILSWSWREYIYIYVYAIIYILYIYIFNLKIYMTNYLIHYLNYFTILLRPYQEEQNLMTTPRP